MTDEEFTEYFKCPESYTTEEERLAAVQECVEWAQKNHPDWTVRQFITFRIKLLEKKGCHETLKNISDNINQKERVQ